MLFANQHKCSFSVSPGQHSSGVQGPDYVDGAAFETLPLFWVPEVDEEKRESAYKHFQTDW